MILDCGHEPSEHSVYFTGYGETSDGKKLCYACIAKRDLAEMASKGYAFLYLNYDAGIVSNWPGSLKFNCWKKSVGKHNLARHRYDVWFIGPNNTRWHGVTVGDNTQICHCRMAKNRKMEN